MIAFANTTAITAAKPTLGTTSFKTSLPKQDEQVASVSGPTMALTTNLRRPFGTGTALAGSYVGSFDSLKKKADDYMAKSVRNQYLAISNATGVFGVQCTEGSVKFAAEVSRVRSLGTTYRSTQRSASKWSFDMFENRKNAIVNSHGCHHEETQFATYTKVAATYNVAQSEATGSCFRYASPESVEEAAMLRYMDIQTKISVNPSGVYNTSCNEGTVKDQAEDIRIAALNTAYRQGQKSMGKILDEKYQQKKHGYIASHGCSYEEGLVSTFPSLGACFRSKSYGY